MKKEEAKLLSLKQSQLVIEYLEQILSDSQKVNGVMYFSYAKINGINICTLDINVLEANFEKRINLQIPFHFAHILYQQVLFDIFDRFCEHETIGVTKFYSIKSTLEDFTGIKVVNSSGSIIKVDFNITDYSFNNTISEYNKKYEEFMLVLKEKNNIKIK